MTLVTRIIELAKAAAEARGRRGVLHYETNGSRDVDAVGAPPELRTDLYVLWGNVYDAWSLYLKKQPKILKDLNLWDLVKKSGLTAGREGKPHNPAELAVRARAAVDELKAKGRAVLDLWTKFYWYGLTEQRLAKLEGAELPVATTTEPIRAAARLGKRTAKKTAKAKASPAELRARDKAARKLCVVKVNEKAARRAVAQTERAALRLTRQHARAAERLEAARACAASKPKGTCKGPCKPCSRRECMARPQVRELAHELQKAQAAHQAALAWHAKAAATLKAAGIPVAPLAPPAPPKRRAAILLPSSQGSPREVPTRYCLVEADQLITSHDPQTFEPDPRYPAATQERRYDRDRAEWPRYVRDLNQGLTQVMDVLAEGVSAPRAAACGTVCHIQVREGICGAQSLARQLPAAALDALASGLADGGELGEFFNSRASLPFIHALEHGGIVTQQNRGRLVASNGLLTEDGRTLAIRQLAAAVLPDADLLELVGPELRQAFARSAPFWLAAASHGGEWDVRPPLQRAVRDLLAARAADLTMRRFFQQADMFEPPHSHRHPVALRMLVLLDKLGGKPAVLARVARYFATEAAMHSGRQATLLQPKHPTVALDEAGAQGKVDLPKEIGALA